MNGAIKLGVGEPCWNEEGTRLTLHRFDKKSGFVSSSIRPVGGFKGRDLEYTIYAVPVKRRSVKP